MTNEVLRLYKSAKKNNEFNIIFENADNDKVPGFFSDNETKSIYASIYYGWMLAKYGVKWRENL